MLYDSATGKLHVRRDDVLPGSWTDTIPLTSGAYLSLRSAAPSARFDDITVSDVMMKFYELGRTRVAMRKAGAVSYRVGDRLGSTSLATDSTGAEATNSRTRYYPYGSIRSGGSGLPTDYRFTGQRSEEAELGSLYDYNARFYAPALGRFLSPDTIVPSPGDPQALNRYSYVRNDPLKYTDPSGHFAVIPLLITGAVGGGIGFLGDLGKQLIVDQKNIADVNWAETGGAAAGGFVAGATLGLAPAGASLLGLAALGGAGGVAGGQVEALTQATLQHYIRKNPQNSILQEARSLGFLDLESALIDGGTGMATGVIGGGLARLFHSSGILSESADVITRRGELPMVRWEKALDRPGKWTFRMEGRVVVVDADTFEKLTRSALQNGLKTAQEILLEAIEQGMVEVIEEQGQP